MHQITAEAAEERVTKACEQLFKAFMGYATHPVTPAATKMEHQGEARMVTGSLRADVQYAVTVEILSAEEVADEEDDV